MFSWADLLGYWRSLLDILLVAVIYYYMLCLMRGTRAMSVLLGLLLILVAYYASEVLNFFTLNWLLKHFLSSFFLIIVILFQKDFRRALAQVGARWLRSDKNMTGDTINSLVSASLSMARAKTGAIIVIEQNVPLGDLVDGGVEVNAAISKELLLSIFYNGTALHDGAVIIQQGKIAAAGCILPLTTNVSKHADYGTRHRAALGLSEETDAIVIVVSEERGVISLAVSGHLVSNVDEGRLRLVLNKSMGIK